MGTRRIYIDPMWRLHTSYHLQELIPYPPEGYEFLIDEGLVEGMFGRISQMKFSYMLMSQIYRLAPLNLIKPYLEHFYKKAPQGTDLTLSYNHLIFRKEPWIVEVDAIWNPIGPNIRHFKKYKKFIERAFSSDYCKKIMCTTEFSRETLISLLDCSRFEQKIEVVSRSVRRKEFIKKNSNEKVRILFIGSANAAGEFELRGGKEVLEAFTILSQKYNDLEIIIRSDISPVTRKRYRQCLEMPNLRLIDTVIPFSELEQIYHSADIFLFPGHYEAWQVILEAMSYELPVIATDVYAAPEHIKNGKTGLLVKSSEEVPYFQEGIPLLSMTPRFQRAIQKVDPKVVADLVDKASILIEDKAMRRKMGKAGRWEIEQGKFSIERRNQELKRVFDEAIGDF